MSVDLERLLQKKLHTFSSFTLSESTFWERSNKTYINDSLIGTLKNLIFVVYNVKQEPYIGVQCTINDER